MKTKMLAVLSASLLAVGCATGGLVGEGPNRQISQSAAQTAAQQHPQIIEEFGGAETSARSSYVTSVGRRVAAQSGVRGAGAGAYTFTTLNSPVLNAFAVPGGYIYITRELLGLMDDEAELASVLGHEIGHIAADHSAQRSSRSQISQVLAALAGVVTGSSQVAQVASTLSQGLVLNYSRSQEFQADDLGIRYMAGAGYDPGASPTLLTSLGAATSLETRVSGGPDERSIPSWARSHPLSADRVTRATRQANATGLANRGTRNRDQFLAQIDGMLWGDDPAQGVVEGRNFFHPDLRLRFTVPNGYGIQNGTRAVTVSGANGQAMFSGGRYQGDLGSYIAQVFRGLAGQTQLNFSQPRATTVNGIPAAYSTARVATQQGQVDLTVFAYQWDSNTAYHFATLTRAGTGLGPFSSLVGSVARLSATEAAAIRPRVIDVVTVRAGDTVQSLASRMAYNDLKLERFLVLNSLAANSQLRAGDKVKLIVYGNRS
ncbi:M48 family metalloprotease [Allosphingosinicella flava]|uniref:M48 family metalloprotease n=1 Tax=Allosphingosinicella flava TaxID=2771430 RepID=A0A7T2LMU9_9SPHN|nr:M48 family metalloprotease [Sphingosinicella flava]QPQ55959.1 M48 family metalloprotease [Sphingosinicella flava]